MLTCGSVFVYLCSTDRHGRN